MFIVLYIYILVCWCIGTGQKFGSIFLSIINLLLLLLISKLALNGNFLYFNTYFVEKILEGI